MADLDAEAAFLASMHAGDAAAVGVAGTDAQGAQAGGAGEQDARVAAEDSKPLQQASESNVSPLAARVLSPVATTPSSAGHLTPSAAQQGVGGDVLDADAGADGRPDGDDAGAEAGTDASLSASAVAAPVSGASPPQSVSAQPASFQHVPLQSLASPSAAADAATLDAPPAIAVDADPDTISAVQVNTPTAPSSAAATPTRSAPKARLPHDRVGMLEDRIRDDPRGDLDAWLGLIAEHRKRNKLDDARAAYERFFKVFPMAVSPDLRRAHHVMAC